MATGATGAARAGLQRPVQLRIPGGRRERCLVASPPGSSAHSRQHRNTPTGRHPLDATEKTRAHEIKINIIQKDKGSYHRRLGEGRWGM